jgi:hypothetical protein
MSANAYDLEKDGIVGRDGVLSEGVQLLNESPAPRRREPEPPAKPQPAPEKK